MKKILFTGLCLALAIVAMAGFAAPGQVAAYSATATKQCISNIVYWYDSYGVVQSVAQNCNLSNQICQNAICVNKPTLPTEVPIQNPTYNPPANNPPTTPPVVVQTPTQTSGPAVLMFVKKSGATNAWQKTVSVATNDTLDFTVLVKNSSGAPMNNVTTQIVLPSGLTYTGNLVIDSITSAGNIGTGISLGTINAHTAKTVTFSGTVQSGITQPATITATASSANGTDSDSLTITAQGSTATTGLSGATAAIVNNTAGAAIFNFFKTWYLWILAALVMIVLFVIIFRRLSSPT